MAAAMYSGLISHSDTSDDCGRDKELNDKDAGVSDDDKGEGEVDEDPDFMASDSPAEEF